MHTLIATGRHINPEATTALVGRQIRDGDQLTVLAVIDHPGDGLRSYPEIDVERILGPESTGQGRGSTDGQIDKTSPSRKQRVVLDQYFGDTQAVCRSHY